MKRGDMRSTFSLSGVLTSLMILWFLPSSCSESASESQADVDVGSTDLSQAPPELMVDSPGSGERLRTTPALVTGTVAGALDGIVTLGTLTAQVHQGFFSLWVPLEQGSNSLTLIHQPSGATAQLELFLDSLPPSLAISGVERGDVFPDGGQVTVSVDASDEQGVSQLTVDGEAGSTGGGTQTTQTTLQPGIHHLVVETLDGLGNLAREHRSVMVGPLLDCDELTQEVTLVVGVGQDLLDILAVETSHFLETADPDSLLDPTTPAFSSSGLEVFMEHLAFEGVVAGLGAGHETLSLGLSVESLTAQGRVVMGGSNYFLTMDMTDVWLQSRIRVRVPEPGILDTQAEDIEMDVDSIDITILDEDGEEFLAPTGVDGPFLEFLTGLLSGFAADSLNQILGERKSLGAGSVATEILGQTLQIEYSAQSASVEPAGLRLEMAGAATLDGEEVHPWVYGCPGGTLNPKPAIVSVGGLQIWIAYPLLNHLMVQLWAHAAMELNLDQVFVDGFKAEVTLVCGMLGTLPGLMGLTGLEEAPLSAGLSVLLPPVLRSGGNEDGELMLSLAEARLAFECAGSPLAQALLSLDAGMALEVKGNRLLPTFHMRRFLLDMEGLDDEAKRWAEAGIEGSFEGLFDELMPALTAALSEIELPRVLGYAITGGVAEDEPGSDWFRLILHVGTDLEELEVP